MTMTRRIIIIINYNLFIFSLYSLSSPPSHLDCQPFEDHYTSWIKVWESNSPPTLTGAGPPANGEYQQGLQLVSLTS